MADASDFATFSKNGSWHLKTQLSYAFAKLLGGELRAIALTTARLAIEHRLAPSLHGMSDDDDDNQRNEDRQRHFATGRSAGREDGGALVGAIIGAIIGGGRGGCGGAIIGAFGGMSEDK